MNTERVSFLSLEVTFKFFHQHDCFQDTNPVVLLHLYLFYLLGDCKQHYISNLLLHVVNIQKCDWPWHMLLIYRNTSNLGMYMFDVVVCYTSLKSFLDTCFFVIFLQT